MKCVKLSGNVSSFTLSNPQLASQKGVITLNKCLNIVDQHKFTSYSNLYFIENFSFWHKLPISHFIISNTPYNCQTFPSEHEQWTTAAAHKAVVIFLLCLEWRSCLVPQRNLSSFIKASSEIQSGICCSLSNCSGTSNSNMC